MSIAYPFSGTPTPHRVQLDSGLPVYAMCGGDALGIPVMADRDGVITSADPYTGEPIRVQRRGGSWSWEPDSAVLLAAVTSVFGGLVGTAKGA